MLKCSNNKFAFLMHPRDIKDITFVYPFLRFVPARALIFFIKFVKPIILKKVCINLNDKIIINGFLIGVFLTADQMIHLPRKFVQKKILQALSLARKFNVGIVGLGGLTSSVTDGGLTLLGSYDVGITSGNAYTVSASIEGLMNILDDRKINLDYVNFCIVGATGSIGQAISKKLSQISSNLLLIGRTPSHLKELKSKIINMNNKVNVTITTDITKVCNSDIIIMATSSPKALIEPNFLKHNAIIYDISQPKNVSQEVIKNRPDVLVVNGGLVEVLDIDLGSNLLLPSHIIYGCLAETLLLTAENRFSDYAIGKVTLQQVDEMRSLGKKYKFRPYTIIVNNNN